MTEDELKALKTRVDADDPDAMCAYAQYIAPFDVAESEKFFELAAQLGQPVAAEHVGDVALAKGDVEHAVACFRIGAKAGILDCSVKIAAANLATDERAAVRELEDLAEIGVKSACETLAEYHKSQGNRKQYAYWRSLVK